MLDPLKIQKFCDHSSNPQIGVTRDLASQSAPAPTGKGPGMKP